MHKPVAFLAALVLFAALSIVGCGAPRTIDLTSCESPYPDPSCPKEETCPGQCLPIPPIEWSDPILLWSGEEMMAPECPADRAGQMVYEGHADPIDPPECPSCTCDPPEGACMMPTTLTASTALCGEFGVAHDFSGLDSTMCNTENPVPASEDPKSVAIAPLKVLETGCKPQEGPPPRDGAASWKTYARGCRGVAFAPCLDPGMLCVPTAEPPPEGFSQCIYREGDNECPTDYPDKRVFFDSGTDTRGCSPCSCGDPTGSVCSATVTTYQDGSCSVVAKGKMVTSAQPECINLPGPPTVALLGKDVKDLTYAPGECVASGGEPAGSADLMGPSTFCCQP